MAKEWAFGWKPNYLATLVISGRKTATCSGLLFYQLENEPIPQLSSEREIILDKQGNPLVEIQHTAIFIEKFGQVSEEFALSEGEGDFAFWKNGHRQFFNSALRDLSEKIENLQGIENGQITEDFELVCERFQVVNIFPKTYSEWLKFAEQTLLENSEQDPFLNAKVDANLLLQAVTKRSKSAIFAFSETLLTEGELKQLAELLARRSQGEPMAYILGEKEFWSLPLKVSTATLIPRPDTERLVELALEWVATQKNKRSDFSENLQILDLGTGTGAIALALASELPNARVIGVDKKPEAVALAEQNRQALGFQNVTFIESDWFDALKNQHFDLIVSNPPYIDAQDPNLSQGDVRFEPLSALVAEQNGLADLQKIIEKAPLVLHQNGALFLEHGWQQGQAVRELFKQYQWDNPQTAQDYGGNDRVTWAIWTK